MEQSVSPSSGVLNEEEPANRPSDAWLQPAAAAPWSNFFDHDLLKCWSEEISQCRIRQVDAAGWELAGSNIALEHEDCDEAEALLRRAAADAGLGFARVPAEAVVEHVDHLRLMLRAHAPVLAMLDWGGWAWGTDDASVAFARRVRRQLSSFDPAAPVLFAVCAASVDAICTDLLKVRAFDRVFALQPSTPEFIGQRFVNLLGEGVADASITGAVAKTGLVLNTTFDSLDLQHLAALQLTRLSRKLGRPVGLADLTELTIRGTRESSPLRKRAPADVSRRRTAYHEAGHACIAVIASGGANVPDYASIVPAKDFEGIVRESLAYHDAQDDFTFDNLLLRVRILLAGRAAEELGFGSRQVSSGANSDLAAATRFTYRHFAHSGFHAGMESGQNSAAFLAVLPRGDTADPLQAGRVHREVRTFLANQYAYAMRALTEHRPFVDAVAERLLWDPVIDQSEMTQIARGHGLLG